MREPLVRFENWGLIPYDEAWEKQEILFKRVVDHKFAQRDLAPELHTRLDNTLVFCEHPHVFTLGKSGDPKNLLLNEEGLKNVDAVYFPNNRGGDITYHGPGQIVGYPIFDLEQFFTDIHKYLRFLEEAIILTLAEYGIVGDRYEGLTGVWIEPDKKSARKICAMGVRCSRWVTMHGFAFNVNTDLSYFKHIVPCGIDDKDVTSMERELGRPVDIHEVADKLKSNLARQFEFAWVK